VFVADTAKKASKEKGTEDLHTLLAVQGLSDFSRVTVPSFQDLQQQVW